MAKLTVSVAYYIRLTVQLPFLRQNSKVPAPQNGRGGGQSLLRLLTQGGLASGFWLWLWLGAGRWALGFFVRW